MITTSIVREDAYKRKTKRAKVGQKVVIELAKKERDKPAEFFQTEAVILQIHPVAFEPTRYIVDAAVGGRQEIGQVHIVGAAK